LMFICIPFSRLKQTTMKSRTRKSLLLAMWTEE